MTIAHISDTASAWPTGTWGLDGPQPRCACHISPESTTREAGSPAAWRRNEYNRTERELPREDDKAQSRGFAQERRPSTAAPDRADSNPEKQNVVDTMFRICLHVVHG